MAEKAFSKWVGGPNFTRIKRYGKSVSNEHPVGRRKTRYYQGRGADAKQYNAMHGARDRAFKLETGRDWFVA